MITHLHVSSDMMVVVPDTNKLEQYPDLQNEVIKGMTYPYNPGTTNDRYKNKPVKEEYRELQTSFTETVTELARNLIESKQVLERLDGIKNSREHEFMLHLLGYVRLNGEHQLHVRFIQHPGVAGNLMKQYVTPIKKFNKGDEKGNRNNEVLVSGALKATHLANGSLVIPLNPVFIHAKPLGNGMTYRVWYAREFVDSFITPQYECKQLREVSDMSEARLVMPFKTKEELNAERAIKKK